MIFVYNNDMGERKNEQRNEKKRNSVIIMSSPTKLQPSLDDIDDGLNKI